MKASSALLLALAVAAIVGGALLCRPERSEESPTGGGFLASLGMTPAAPRVALTLVRAPGARAEARAARDLFAYREKPQPAPVAVTTPAYVPPPVVAPPQVTVQTDTAPPPKRFEYAYLGHFGPEGKSIAVFKKDGDVVNASVGEALGEFTLHKVEREAVHVSAAGEALQSVKLKE